MEVAEPFGVQDCLTQEKSVEEIPRGRETLGGSDGSAGRVRLGGVMLPYLAATRPPGIELFAHEFLICRVPGWARSRFDPGGYVWWFDLLIKAL